jgi:hypothetical protein
MSGVDVLADQSTDDDNSGDAQADIQDAFGGYDIGVDAEVSASDLGLQDINVGELTILTIDPVSGSSTGSTMVTLTGSGFDDSVSVWFGRSRSPSVFVISPGLLNCVAPPGGAGPVDVRATDNRGRVAVSPVKFIYESSLALDSIDPSSGPSSGGTPVIIRGRGFYSNPSVFIGGRSVVASTVVSDSEILAVTPPGEAGSGQVAPDGSFTADVRLLSATGDVRAKNAFTYLYVDSGPQLPDVGVQACTPARGASVGGSKISIIGHGFRPGMGVRIGALPCTQVKYVSETVLDVITPPGTPGSADVVVSYGFGVARLDSGFFYLGADGGTMGIFETVPPDASWSGGSLVAIRGFGLSGVNKVYFGSLEATDLQHVSDFEITVRTPRSEVAGPSFVMTLGTGGAMLQDGFRFYDPYIYGGGVWGPPVDGTLNVSVFNGSTGGRVPGAWVIVGSDLHTPWQGRTDDRGQITFSDVGLDGPLNVSAAADMFTAATFVDFDGRNATLTISSAPSPENPSEPPPGEPTTPCVVDGRVTDYNKYFIKPQWLDGTAWVECFPSSNSMYSYLTTIPAQNRPDSHGRFSMTARSGEFAIFCRLMVQEIGAAEGYPIRMGVRRHVRCQDDQAAEVLVSLDIPTESVVRFGITGIPSYASGVWEPRFSGGWHLGTDGYFPLPSRGAFDGSAEIFAHMPDRWDGDGQTDLAGDGFDLYVTVSSKEPNGMPYSVVQAFDVIPAMDGALLAGDPGALTVTPTALTGSFAAFHMMDDGQAMAVDESGRTWIYDGVQLVAGQVSLNGRVNDVLGASPDDFAAVGPRGRITIVKDQVVTRVETGFLAELYDMDGESPDLMSIAAGPMLINRVGELIRVESMPSGSDVRAVRRFPDGRIFAVGPDGIVVNGFSGQPLSAVRPVAEDLLAVAGLTPDMVWAAGENGRVISIRDDNVFVLKAPTSSTIRGIVVLGDCDVLFYGDGSSVFRFDCFEFTDVSPAGSSDYKITGGVAFADGAGGFVPEGDDYVVLVSSRITDLSSFAGFPTIAVPAENQPWNGRDIAWASGLPWDATHCQAVLSGLIGLPFWQITSSGRSSSVELPDFARISGYNPVPTGLKRMNMTCSRAPGFDISNFDYRSLGFNSRETFSVDLASFF